MPVEVRKICYHPGCRSLAIPGKSRCEKHEAVKHVGTSRNRSGDPFYATSDWRKLKQWKLRVNPTCECEHCVQHGLVTPATVVDHVRPRRFWPELELEPLNLRSMSAAHHNSHTARTRHWTKEQFPPWKPPTQSEGDAWRYT